MFLCFEFFFLDYDVPNLGTESSDQVGVESSNRQEVEAPGRVPILKQIHFHLTVIVLGRISLLEEEPVVSIPASPNQTDEAIEVIPDISDDEDEEARRDADQLFRLGY